MHGDYKPSHHSDAAFFRAIEFGAPQHHWGFGDMKPVAGVDREQAQMIVDFSCGGISRKPGCTETG